MKQFVASHPEFDNSGVQVIHGKFPEKLISLEELVEESTKDMKSRKEKEGDQRTALPTKQTEAKVSITKMTKREEKFYDLGYKQGLKKGTTDGWNQAVKAQRRAKPFNSWNISPRGRKNRKRNKKESIASDTGASQTGEPPSKKSKIDE